MSRSRKKLTIPDLQTKKRAGERVVLASVTDYLMAQWAERGGGDVVAVAEGLTTTRPQVAARQWLRSLITFPARTSQGLLL